MAQRTLVVSAAYWLMAVILVQWLESSAALARSPYDPGNIDSSLVFGNQRQLEEHQSFAVEAAGSLLTLVEDRTSDGVGGNGQRCECNFWWDLLHLDCLVYLSPLLQVILSGATAVLLIWSLVQTRKAIKIATLDHPPDFDFTRPAIIPRGWTHDNRLDVDFRPGVTLKGSVFAVNKGRFPVDLALDDRGVVQADCYFHWQRHKDIPMDEAYARAAALKAQKVARPDFVDGDGNPIRRLNPRQYGCWNFETIVPDDFSISRHTLFMTGHITIVQKGLKDKVGFHFCKRYVPSERRFVTYDDDGQVPSPKRASKW